MNSDSNQNNRIRNEKKATRITFSETSKKKLELFFASIPYPTIKERESLAAEINIPEKQIRYWFQNCRNRLRKEGKLERLASSNKSNTNNEASNSNDSSYTRSCDSTSTNGSSSSNANLESNSSMAFNFSNYAPFISQLYNYANQQNIQKATEVKIPKPLFRPYE